MKNLLPIFIFFYCSNFLLAQEDSLTILEEFENVNMNATSIFISTQGYFLENERDSTIQLLNQGSEFFVLSLVDSTLYHHWEEQIESFANQYANSYLLIVVSADDSSQRADFISELYQQQSQEDDIELAYQNTVAIIEKKYSELDFKHFFRKAN